MAGMTAEEIRLRSQYLYFSCLHAATTFQDRLTQVLNQAHLSAPQPRQAAPSLEPYVNQLIRREIGVLFRYWVAHYIWEFLQGREAEAKELNLAILRLFVEGFRLPRDGSGLQYAMDTASAETVRKLTLRLCEVLKVDERLLMGEVTTGVLLWRDAILSYCREAVTLPPERLQEAVAGWLKTTTLPEENPR